MQTIQATVRNPSLDHFLGQAQLVELPAPYDPMLPPRQPGDLPVKSFRV
jgi:hypothetical protein